jgi:hypothetical protein
MVEVWIGSARHRISSTSLAAEYQESVTLIARLVEIEIDIEKLVALLLISAISLLGDSSFL